MKAAEKKFSSGYVGIYQETHIKWSLTVFFNGCHPVVRHNTIIYKYLRQYTTILVLMQIYFVLGDMFRLLIKPSSGQIYNRTVPYYVAPYRKFRLKMAV